MRIMMFQLSGFYCIIGAEIVGPFNVCFAAGFMRLWVTESWTTLQPNPYPLNPYTRKP